MHDAVKKVLYKSAATGMQSGFNVATADAFTPPVVNKITTDKYHGVSWEDSITIDATDDFKVESVSVAIHDATGNLIEQGNAVLQTDSPDWLYTATVANALHLPDQRSVLRLWTCRATPGHLK